MGEEIENRGQKSTADWWTLSFVEVGDGGEGPGGQSIPLSGSGALRVAQRARHRAPSTAGTVSPLQKIRPTLSGCPSPSPVMVSLAGGLSTL